MRKFHHNDEVIWDEVDGTTVLCHTRTGAFFRTNEVGRLIWEAAMGRSLDEVVRVVCEAYPGVNPDQVRSDVTDFLDELIKAGLLKVVNEPVAQASGAAVESLENIGTNS